jgi:hypothetical protein
MSDAPTQYAGKLKTQLYWWLSKHRPFFINDDYKIELLYIDKEHLTAKLLITNLKSGETQEIADDNSVTNSCQGF